MAETPLLKQLLVGNAEYARTFDRSRLPLPPAKKLAILRAWMPESTSMRSRGSGRETLM